MSNCTVRIAELDDAADILGIYAHYVLNTAVTFEHEVPSLDEFTVRVGSYLSRYPYIVATDDGAIIGFTYAGPLRQRTAYAWAVETSIYVKHDCRQNGVGRMLYETLEDILRRQGFTNMLAAVAYAQEEDEYLSLASPRFHERLGYSHVGRFTQCGHKFGRWYDLSWWEKQIAPHQKDQPPITPFPLIRRELGL